MNQVLPKLLLLALIGLAASQDESPTESPEDPTAGALQTPDEPLTEACIQETETLLMDPNLLVSQEVIFEDYEAAYNDVCDFGLGNLGCSIQFEGDTRTYESLCESKGGQIYSLPVRLSCLLGTIDYDLGVIPTCVGGSCNVTNVRPADVESPQVEAFLDNLTFVGCSADSGSSASSNYPFSGGFLALLVSGLGFLLL